MAGPTPDPSLQLGCAIHNPSLYYVVDWLEPETQSEPTQRNITLCYESRAAVRSLEGFHVVRRAPGVLPLAGRHRARAVLRANDRAHRHPRWIRHGGKLQRIGASWEYSACVIGTSQNVTFRARF